MAKNYQILQKLPLTDLLIKINGGENCIFNTLDPDRAEKCGENEEGCVNCNKCIADWLNEEENKDV